MSFLQRYDDEIVSVTCEFHIMQVMWVFDKEIILKQPWGDSNTKPSEPSRGTKRHQGCYLHQGRSVDVSGKVPLDVA